MTDSLFSAASLLTVSSCSLAVYLLTEMTKESIDKIYHFHTEFLSTIYAYILLVLAQLALGANPANWTIYFLAIPNSVLVAAAAAQVQTKAASNALKSYIAKSSPNGNNPTSLLNDTKK